MKRIGILAYGSLIDDPKEEIEAAMVDRIANVETPFKVEFARSSKTRDYAPTLIPVESGGANIKAQIFVLKEGISEKDAANMLWRRETHQVGSRKTYKRSSHPGINTVLIEQLDKKIPNIDVVFYAKIGVNIKPLEPQRLARLAIDSALCEAGSQGLDGISYLVSAKRNGIQTPLMPKYEEEILQEVGATTLEDALEILHFERLKREGKIPEETEILKSPPTPKEAGKFVAFRATIGETYVKLSPPIALVGEYEGEKHPTSCTTVFLGLKARIDHSYLYVGFKKNTKQNDVVDYFNNLMALFNIVLIPFDFVTISDILVQAKGIGAKIEVISSSKAHSRGYGILPVEISSMDFSKIVIAMQYLWEKIKKSKYFKDDNFFQLLGYAQYYLFHENYFLSFIHSWIFLESCINVIWREMIADSFKINGSSEKGTPLEEERNWTNQIMIDDLFLKDIIGKNIRNELQSLRKKRNKVFHRDKQKQKRTVTAEDAEAATTTGLRLLYAMIESEPEEGVFAFLDIREKMWATINRGQLHRTKITKKRTSS